MGKYAELEYTKLLENESIDRELLEHPQFYESFLREYENASLGEKYPVEIKVSNNSIALLRRGNYPDATNGIFYGVKDINCYKFSLERKRDKVYLRIEHDSSTVHTFPQKGDNISNSREVQIYEDNVLLGRAYFYNGGNYYQANITPYLGFTVPEEMSVGYILTGSIPNSMSNRIAGDYDYQVSGRYGYEDGIVKGGRQSRFDNKYDTKYYRSSINLENPFTIDNANRFAILDSMGRTIELHPEFETLSDAEKYFQERYLEAIGKGKTL